MPDWDEDVQGSVRSSRNRTTGFIAWVLQYDPLGRIGRVKGKTVALIRRPGALEGDCRSDRHCALHCRREVPCHADHRRAAHAEARTFYIEGLSIRTETVAQAFGKRPWARATAQMIE